MADSRSLQRAKEIFEFISDTDLPTILVGTKSDLWDQRQVSHEEALSTANSLDCQYVETSAALKVNVKELFQLAVNLVLKQWSKCSYKPLEKKMQDTNSLSIKKLLQKWLSFNKDKKLLESLCSVDSKH